MVSKDPIVLRWYQHVAVQNCCNSVTNIITSSSNFHVKKPKFSVFFPRFEFESGYMDNTISQIRDFADKAHGDQTRRYTPDRYIVHPTRVMEICQQYTNDRAMLAAALLHDVLEDTDVTKDEIEDLLLTVMDHQQAQRTIKLVVELTDIYVKKNFPQMNRRKRKIKEADRLEKTSAEAQTIKYADIIDNSGEIA